MVDGSLPELLMAPQITGWSSLLPTFPPDARTTIPEATNFSIAWQSGSLVYDSNRRMANREIGDTNVVLVLVGDHPINCLD